MRPSELTIMPEPTPEVGTENGERPVVPWVEIVTTDGSAAAATLATTPPAVVPVRAPAGAEAALADVVLPRAADVADGVAAGVEGWVIVTSPAVMAEARRAAPTAAARTVLRPTPRRAGVGAAGGTAGGAHDPSSSSSVGAIHDAASIGGRS
jgi:hypothetical protein